MMHAPITAMIAPAVDSDGGMSAGETILFPPPHPSVEPAAPARRHLLTHPRRGALPRTEPQLPIIGSIVDSLRTAQSLEVDLDTARRSRNKREPRQQWPGLQTVRWMVVAGRWKNMPRVRRGWGAESRRMTKSELFTHFAERFGIKRAEAGEFFDELQQLTEQELLRCGEFVLPGVAKLVVQQRERRMGRNPATGARVEIPAKQVVKARIAKQLKDVVEA